VSDELLLRAYTVRGGLRRLTQHMFAHASARHREQVYRQLVHRTRELVAQRGAVVVSMGSAKKR
jgi:hypothetical protein